MGMNKLGYTTIIVVGVAICLLGCPSTTGLTGIVYFPDKALESAVRAELGQPFGPISELDMLQLQSLDARGLGIWDLTGLEYATNLTWADFATNNISDLKPLENLVNVTALDLGDNELFEVAPLAGLLQVQTLHLNKNNIADIQPLVTNAKNGGLGPGDSVTLEADRLGQRATTVDVPNLRNVYGVSVDLVETVVED